MSEASPPPNAKLELVASRQFTSWLAEQRVSLVFTTYQAGKLFLIGLQPNGRLSVFERTFNRCMGVWSNGQTIWMTSLFQLWRFENVLQPGQTSGPNGVKTAGDHDRLYVPMTGHTTGDIDIHDVAVERDGRVVFVNTLFNCLATISPSHSFAPLWKPPFISQLAAEDRCHLNGLALLDGKAQYVTAVSRSDVVDGWRDHRREGGLVIDVTTNETVVDGLSMPHSPRTHPAHPGKLWLLNSGTGEFGFVDLKHGRFEPISFCPGYTRGMAFVGHYAVIGLSRCRENRTFSGLTLDENLKAKGAEPRCGLHVIDLRTGDAAHWLRVEGIVAELYDVVALPGVRRPMALGFKTDEIRTTLSIGDVGAL